MAFVIRQYSAEACSRIARTVRPRPRIQMKADLEPYKRSAVSAAREAGALINAAFSKKDKGIQFKGAVDLVTETDKACEQLIYNTLQRSYPDHKFIGEEGSSAQGFTDALTDEPTWMCDPVDGTTNFVHGYPSCCVSLALAIKKQVVVGVVYSPVLDELFVAAKGEGATLNGRTISVSAVRNLQDALFCSEVGNSRNPDTMHAIFSRIQALTQQTRSFRAQGSCALDLCAAACGRIDFMFEIGFGGCWDCAAGVAIVEEAGGVVLDPSGSPFNLMSRRVLAGNKNVTAKAAEVLAKQPLSSEEPQPQAL